MENDPPELHPPNIWNFPYVSSLFFLKASLMLSCICLHSLMQHCSDSCQVSQVETLINIMIRTEHHLYTSSPHITPLHVLTCFLVWPCTLPSKYKLSGISGRVRFNWASNQNFLSGWGEHEALDLSTAMFYTHLHYLDWKSSCHKDIF